MEQKWMKVIEPKTRLFDLKLKELVRYRDLIWMFVKRNFASAYKQTVLGPLWFIINPLITSVLFTIVFGGIAKISTDGVPQMVFYMAGNTAWSYFATCLTSTSSTFTANAGVFGKVYFPRLVMPISTVIYGLLSFAIQFCVLMGFIVYFIAMGENVQPNITVCLIPVYIIHMAALGLGTGIIISSMTTKYRDLTILVGFGVQLWMYITPIVYPLSTVPEQFRNLIMYNPMAPIINNFKYSMLGCGKMEWGYWGISAIVTAVIVFIGLIVFNRVEKTFMDTV